MNAISKFEAVYSGRYTSGPLTASNLSELQEKVAVLCPEGATLLRIYWLEAEVTIYNILDGGWKPTIVTAAFTTA